MIKVYVVGNSKYYASFLTNVELTDDITKAKIVLFTGGEDVDPSLYGKKKHPSTYSNLQRDLYEKEIFSQMRKSQLAVGICRGSQFLCVMNGGILVQNCTNHALFHTHRIFNADRTFFYEITSTHHQMQYPFVLPKTSYDILYHAEQGSCVEGDGISSDPIVENEPEVVVYHRKNLPKCIAIQGHPEMIPNSPVAKMLDELIKSYVH